MIFYKYIYLQTSLSLRRGGVWRTPKEAFCCRCNRSRPPQQLHSQVRITLNTHQSYWYQIMNEKSWIKLVPASPSCFPTSSPSVSLSRRQTLPLLEVSVLSPALCLSLLPPPSPPSPPTSTPDTKTHLTPLLTQSHDPVTVGADQPPAASET